MVRKYRVDTLGDGVVEWLENFGDGSEMGTVQFGAEGDCLLTRNRSLQGIDIRDAEV